MKNKAKFMFLCLLIFISNGITFARPLNIEHEHHNGQFIVKFKNTGLFQSRSFLKILGGEINHTFSNGAILIKFPAQVDASGLVEIAEQIESLSDVEYIEADTKLHAIDTVPNDSDYGSLWGLEKISAPKAWDITKGDRKSLVAVIDSGVDYEHPDLKDNYAFNKNEIGEDENGRDKRNNGIDDDGNGFVDDWRGWDFANNDNNPYDDNGHGSHCAGTIGAFGDNGYGVVGVNWKAAIVGIKFLDAQGSGYLSDAVKSIDYAISLGATVTSNSWGGGGKSETMRAAIQRANDAGVLFVAAAGNRGTDNDHTPHYPSNYDVPNVIAVAASNEDDELAYFSQYGKKTVHLAAPGTDILSTTPHSNFRSMNGTSMAAPHVAGAVALLKSNMPDAKAAEIKEKILSTVDSSLNFADKTISGGVLNLFNMLEDDKVPPNAISNLEIFAESMTSFQLSFLPAGDNGSEGQASSYIAKIFNKPIETDEEWQEATLVELHAQKEEDNYYISGLPLSSHGFLAIKAKDNAGNIGPVSSSVYFELEEVDSYAFYPANSMDEVDSTGPWGLELDENDNSVFSDSPNKRYRSHSNWSLNLKPVLVHSSNVLLKFDTFFSTEKRFDYVLVELSVNNGNTWSEVDRMTGESGTWIQKTLSLEEFLSGSGEGQEVLIRFRIYSDYSIIKDGIKLDNISIMGAS